MKTNLKPEKRMQAPLVISVAIHAGILLAGMVALPSPEEYRVDKVESVPVDIMTIDEFNQLKQQKKDARPKPDAKPPEPEKKTEPEPVKEPEPEPKPEPRREAVVEPPAPEPEPEVAPAPPEPEKKAEPEPEPEPKAEAKPLPKPQRKPRPPKDFAKKKEKPKFSPDKIAALLNKLPDEEKPKQRQRNDDAGTPDQGPADRPLGLDQRVTQNEENALRAQIEKCWSPPIGLANAQDLIVRLRIRLNPDGGLQGTPEIVNRSGDQYFTIAAESAIRAVERCQPFTMPPAKYQAWKDIILNFNPRDLFQG